MVELALGAVPRQGWRSAVLRWAVDCGLEKTRAAGLSTAVSAVASNSLTHGGGPGILRMWQEGATLIFEVRDRVVIDTPLVGREGTPEQQSDSWGLGMANQLCDLVQIRSSAQGTTVRLHAILQAHPERLVIDPRVLADQLMALRERLDAQVQRRLPESVRSLLLELSSTQLELIKQVPSGGVQRSRWGAGLPLPEEELEAASEFLIRRGLLISDPGVAGERLRPTPLTLAARASLEQAAAEVEAEVLALTGRGPLSPFLAMFANPGR